MKFIVVLPTRVFNKCVLFKSRVVVRVNVILSMSIHYTQGGSNSKPKKYAVALDQDTYLKVFEFPEKLKKPGILINIFFIREQRRRNRIKKN